MNSIRKEVLGHKIKSYEKQLKNEELSPRSVKKYLGDISRFMEYLSRQQIEEINEFVLEEYRNYQEERCSKKSCNSYFISLNKFFRYADAAFLNIKLYQVSPKLSLENVLTLEEYRRLLHFTDNEKYYRCHLIMKTLGCTGIRIGELQFITYETLLEKKVEVTAKRKTRIVYFSEEIYTKLMEYCNHEHIKTGIIFRTKTGRPLDTGNIWRSLKVIAARAGVDEAKVYPHSFRHLFAKTYIEKFQALDELADILGHTSIETTRIYTRTTGEEKRERLNLLGL